MQEPPRVHELRHHARMVSQSALPSVTLSEHRRESLSFGPKHHYRRVKEYACFLSLDSHLGGIILKAVILKSQKLISDPSVHAVRL